MDQLGDPSTNKKYEDTPFVIQPNQKFAEIAIGSDFSVAINHYGVVYSWGSAEAQQVTRINFYILLSVLKSFKLELEHG